MRSWEIGQHIAQLHRFRETVGDHMSPVDSIVRPPGMKKYLFEARIANIKRLESLIRQKLAEDSEKWVKRGYKA